MSTQENKIEKSILLLAKQAKDLRLQLKNNINENIIIEIKKAVKDNLISDLDDDSFCDLLSQTIAYGFFATYIAFLEDPNTLPSHRYTLKSVLYYMPPGNKFIQNFFQGIFQNLVKVSEEDAIRKSIKEIYESVKSFSFNQEEISNWEWERKGSLLTMSYEIFLESYDKEKRKSLGAWYTPEYIVDHMIRFSHYLLINKLNIENGFLNEEYIEKKQSKLQILDPATGTGNFLTRLAESICLSSNVVVNSNNRKDANFYIDDHLINKLNGFELSMLSYIIANFNLDNVFRKFGYNNRGVQRQRTNIYLTNTLDNSVISIDENVQGFERLLAKETEAANVIKNEKPVFVVIGNPPYNGASKNNSKFITNLMETYKPDFNTCGGLNDDYIKFFRFAHDLINKNKTGLISYITSNSFLSNRAYQKMRETLLKDFDEIYIINLNGSKTKEDENVFDIKTNVCISYLIKNNTKEKDANARLFYYDIVGTVENKQSFLSSCLSTNENFLSFDNIKFEEILFLEEDNNYFFIPLDNELLKVYNKGFSLGDIFKVKGSGVKTNIDELLVNTKLNKLKQNIKLHLESEDSPFKGPCLDKKEKDSNGIYKIFPYRAFDSRYYYDSKMSDGRRLSLTEHESIENNYYLGFTASVRDNNEFKHIIITKNTPDAAIFTGKATTHSAPLYIYNEQNKIESNIKESFIKEINDCLGDTEIQAKHIMDYIYGYLNMPSYVEKYNDLLKQNYPRVPYPQDYNEFHRIASIGAELRQYHLFSFEIETISSIEIDNTCKMNVNNKGQVSVNNNTIIELQNNTWEFKIGACQVIKNWIKSRQDEEITYEDFLHFLKMIIAIEKTIKLRKTLDES